MTESMALTTREDHQTAQHDGERAASALVLPVAEPQRLVEAMRQYQATKDAILDPTDYQDSGDGRRFIKKSGWAKLAIAFAASSQIVDGYPRTELDEEGSIIGAECRVIATAPNGRTVDGWGYCSIEESRFTNRDGKPNWKGRQKLRHDLPATAETRARNRAYSNLFGHGEVSAEEIAVDGDDAPANRRSGGGDWEALYDADTTPQGASGSDSFPKASPYKAASANQMATAAKLTRLLGQEEQAWDGMTSAEISEHIQELSREYNETKGTTRRNAGA